MAETTRERIDQDEARIEEQAPGVFKSTMQSAYKHHDLIPRDEHEAAVTAAYEAGKARAAVIVMEHHATDQKPPQPHLEWDTFRVGFGVACRRVSRAIRADEELMK